MLGDFESEISSSGLSDEEQAYHMECTSLVISALAPVRMNAPWDQSRLAISETLISKLQSADMALRRSVKEQLLIESDLLELRACIEAALENIKQSTLPQELKSFIALHLIRIRTALDEYEYRGVIGLQEALAGYLGSLAVAKDEIDEHTTESQKLTFSQVLTVANGVMTFAHSVALMWPQLHTGFAAIAGLLRS